VHLFSSPESCGALLEATLRFLPQSESGLARGPNCAGKRPTPTLARVHFEIGPTPLGLGLVTSRQG
jgi:hypothetical protein